MNTPGERIKACRIALKLNQEMFGRRLGVGKSAVSQWETGATLPETETLQRIATLAGESVEWILAGEEKDPPASSDEMEIRNLCRGMRPQGRAALLVVARALAAQFPHGDRVF